MNMESKLLADQVTRAQPAPSSADFQLAIDAATRLTNVETRLKALEQAHSAHTHMSLTSESK
jgi:hypothetical protein